VKGDDGLRDFDRPLDGQGKKDAARMGRELARRGLCPGAIVTSPAVRALATAELIAAETGLPEDRLSTDERIYHADAGALFDVAAGFPDEWGNAAIVGHNPALLDFINAAGREPIAELPACAVVRLEFGAGSWSEISPLSGRVTALLRPALPTPQGGRHP